MKATDTSLKWTPQQIDSHRRDPEPRRVPSNLHPSGELGDVVDPVSVSHPDALFDGIVLLYLG